SLLFYIIHLTRLPPRSPLFPYTTLFRSAHLSISRLICSPNCSGVPPTGGLASAISRSRTSGIARLFCAAALSALTTAGGVPAGRSEEHTSELQSRFDLVCRLLLEKKKNR